MLASRPDKLPSGLMRPCRKDNLNLQVRERLRLSAHPRERLSAMEARKDLTSAISLSVIVLMLSYGGALGLEPDAQRGQTFVRANCAQCHSIDKISNSPLKIAPPFRNLHIQY